MIFEKIAEGLTPELLKLIVGQLLLIVVIAVVGFFAKKIISVLASSVSSSISIAKRLRALTDRVPVGDLTEGDFRAINNLIDRWEKRGTQKEQDPKSTSGNDALLSVSKGLTEAATLLVNTFGDANAKKAK